MLLKKYINLFLTYLKKIEYLLILISIFCFSIVSYYSRKVENVFMEFDSNLSNLMLISDFRSDKIVVDNFFAEFDEQFHTYVFFDEDLRNTISDLRFKNYSLIEFKINFIVFKNKMLKFYNQLKFCYDSLLFSSVSIFVVAIIVIIIKNFSKSIELEKLKTAEKTQKQISMDLHDSVAQDLATIKFNLQNGDNERAALYANQAINEVRYIINATRIDFDDFEESLRKMFKAFEDNFKIDTKCFIASTSIQNIDSDMKLELYRIFQESLNNIAKHSKATSVVIKIIDFTNDLKISISDNGIGIKEDDFKKGNHYGLKNIRERIEKIGGKVEFKNNGGTEIAIQFENIVR